FLFRSRVHVEFARGPGRGRGGGRFGGGGGGSFSSRYGGSRSGLSFADKYVSLPFSFPPVCACPICPPVHVLALCHKPIYPITHSFPTLSGSTSISTRRHSVGSRYDDPCIYLTIFRGIKCFDEKKAL